MWLIEGYYAKRRNNPTRRERKMVMRICNMLCEVSESAFFVSIHSTIFIAGKAIKTSITIEKTSVNTISSILIFRNIDGRILLRLWLVI